MAAKETDSAGTAATRKALTGKQAAKPVCVVPVDGWEVQTPWGTLKTRTGADLVRLEDVHAWMMGKGIPPKDAVLKVFSPFYLACLEAQESAGDRSEGLNLLAALHLLNALSFPDGIFRDGAQSRVESVRVLASGLPDLEHVRFPEGSVGALVYSMGEGAMRVWRGRADICTDHLAAWKDKKERAEEEKYSIKWPADEDLRKLLGRLAVPHATAHELWGWGSVATGEVVQLYTVPAENVEPTNWTGFVCWRKENRGHEFSPALKEIVAAERTRRGSQPGAAKAMAGELGMSVARLNELIRKKDESGSRAKVRRSS